MLISAVHQIAVFIVFTGGQTFGAVLADRKNLRQCVVGTLIGHEAVLDFIPIRRF